MNNLLVLFIFLTETIAAQNVSVTLNKKGKILNVDNFALSLLLSSMRKGKCWRDRNYRGVLK